MWIFTYFGEIGFWEYESETTISFHDVGSPHGENLLSNWENSCNTFILHQRSCCMLIWYITQVNSIKPTFV